jgi:hypothetical protein
MDIAWKHQQQNHENENEHEHDEPGGITESDCLYLVAGCKDGSVGKWQVRRRSTDKESCQVRLCWRTTRGELYMEGAIVQDVQGLSKENARLLEQRGAVVGGAAEGMER